MCFAQSFVEYLGNTLSRNGVSKGKKLDAVIRMPPCLDVSTLHSFLGSVQFYGKLIPNLTTLSENLNRLLRKETPWTWSAQEQEAFKTLKIELGKDHVLVHFDPALYRWVFCAMHLTLVLGWSYFIVTQIAVSAQFPMCPKH